MTPKVRRWGILINRLLTCWEVDDWDRVAGRRCGVETPLAVVAWGALLAATAAIRASYSFPICSCMVGDQFIDGG